MLCLALHEVLPSILTNLHHLSFTQVLSFRDLHNLISAIGSFVATIAVLMQLSQRPLTAHGLLCQPAEPAPVMVAAWYLSKMYEWVDTVMLIAAGKQLSSLHYNHHLTTATVVASHIVGRGGGGARTSIFDIPMLLNGGVHTIM